MKPAPVVLIVACLSLFALAPACGPAGSYRVDDLQPKLAATGNRKLAVATHDQREYIRKDEKERSYLGALRKSGIPYDMLTASGKPLADDLTGVLCAALTRAGYTVLPIQVVPHFTELDVVKALTEKGAGRSVLLVLSEWMSDTRGELTDLRFDLRLSVINEHRSMVAQARIKGQEQLSGPAGQQVPQALQAKLEQLLGHADVSATLGDPVPDAKTE